MKSWLSYKQRRVRKKLHYSSIFPPESYWFRGNIHAHTTGSYDGNSTPAEVCEWYKGHGYDFVAITDHDAITDVSLYETSTFKVFKHSAEISGQDILALGIKSLPIPSLSVQGKINIILDQNGIAILCHPNWKWNHWTLEAINSILGYCAIEVYNANIEKEEGSAYATEKWDYILSQDKIVWGIAVDDGHDAKEDTLGKGWIMVKSKLLTIEAIKEAIKKGDFYATTGVIIKDIIIEGKLITIDAENANKILFIGGGGQILTERIGPKASYEIRGDEGYVRAECLGEEGKAFTQPLFI